MGRSRKQDTVDQTELKLVVDWLSALREKHRLTQNDFANRIGVSTTYVNMLLQRKRKPSFLLLRRIADTFGESSSLQSVLPRAYSSITLSGQNLGASSAELTVDEPLSSLFEALDQQAVVSTGNFTVEEINDGSLGPWGIRDNSFALTERVTASDLIAGDLVLYGPQDTRRWGFIHVVGSEAFIISAGYHLRELLKINDSEWIEAGLHHLDISRYLLKQYLETSTVRKVRLILGPLPNLRTPILTHPAYQSLRPADRYVVDQTITRFTSYARGLTDYQPSQHRSSR